MSRKTKKKTYPVTYTVGLVISVLSGRRIIVRIHRVDVPMLYNSGFSPVVGHTVRVARSRGRWSAIGPVSDGDVTIPAGDDAPNLPTSGTYGPLRPIYAGTWTGSRWVAGDLVQGSRLGTAQIGCAFYGSGPRVKLRQPVTAVHLRLRGTDPRTLGTVQIRPLVANQRPGGAPAFAGAAVASAALVGTAPVDVVLPGAGAHLVAGDWGGFAVYDPAPTQQLAVGTELDSLTLTMDWSA